MTTPPKPDGAPQAGPTDGAPHADAAVGDAASPAAANAGRPGGRAARPGARYRPRPLRLRDGRVLTLRAVTEADAPAIQRAFDRLSHETRYQRFMHHKKQLSPEALQRGVHPLPGRDFVFVATQPVPGGYEVVGAAQYVRARPDDDSTCEFAITLAEDWRGCGLARQLLASLVRRARRDHYAQMIGLVLADNAPMLALARRLGFEAEPTPDASNTVTVRRRLAPRPAPPASGRGIAVAPPAGAAADAPEPTPPPPSPVAPS